MHISFVTQRCQIHKFQAEDLPALISYRNDELWMKYQSFKGLSADEYRRALLCDCALEEGIQLAITKKAAGTLIGDLYVKREGHIFWVGATVHPHFARMGYAQEALTGLIHWLCGEFKGVEICAGAEPENLASNKLLAKMGFQYRIYDPESNENIYSSGQLS